MKDNATIFYFHSGKAYYLPYSINQTLAYNTDCEIIFLGDEIELILNSRGVKFVNFNDYFDKARLFGEYYEHMSPNSIFTERICFQRWISLSEYCEKNKIEGRIVLLDSDVLLYCNLKEYMNRNFKEYEIAVSGDFGPGYVMFNSRKILSKLSDFILNYYVDSEKFQNLVQEWKFLQNEHNSEWGISDMTLIDRYIREEKIRKLNLCEIINGKCFDTHIGQTNDNRFPPRKKNGKKTIFFVDKRPFCINVLTNEKIEFLSLHFQGHWKEEMFLYYTGPKSVVPNRFSANKRKIWQKIKTFIKKMLKILRRIFK